jgi:protein SCO1
MNKAVLLIIGAAFCLIMGVYYSLKPADTYKVQFYQYNNNTQKVEKYFQPFESLHKIDFFLAKDQNGVEYNSDSIYGKIYVVDYFFVTCPGICKQMGVQMKRLYSKYLNDNDVTLISFTSKPEEDSIPVLKEYALRMGVQNNAKWKLLHANRTLLHNLAKKEFGILNEDDDENEFVHTERFALIDKKGYIRGYYDGTSAQEVDKLMQDITWLKEEDNKEKDK